MFGLTHILYIVISLVITVGFLIGVSFVKNQTAKDWILKGLALVTFILHISILWVDYLNNGFAEVNESILWPIYFCNLIMYMLLITVFIKNKKGKVFNWMATFVAYGAIFGGLITLMMGEYFDYDPYMQTWETIKSMVSHSTMLIGGLYLFIGGYVKIRVSNLIKYFCGLVFSMLVGFIVNGIYKVFLNREPNAMYLQRTPLPGVEFLNGYGIALLMVILIFVFTVIWEQFAVKKGERWYNNIAKMFKSKKRKERVNEN